MLKPEAERPRQEGKGSCNTWIEKSTQKEQGPDFLERSKGLTFIAATGESHGQSRGVRETPKGIIL